LVVKESHRRFENLFREHSASVRGYARRRVPADLADEVVSEVFVVAWRRLAEVPQDALPWLLGCARRVIANQRRSVSRQRALSERLQRVRPAEAAQISESTGHLRQALAALSERDREVLMLTAWEELAPADAALVLSCSERAFAMRLHRARRRLAAELDKQAVAPRAAWEVT
jgi:RNA polymerase sigma factor (sigma-70 family)